MSTPWLTDDEIDDMCDGLEQNAAKVRFLRAKGLTVTEKHNGRPLVLRSNVEATLGGLPKSAAGTPPQRNIVRPNRAGFKLLFGGKAG